MGTIGLKGSYSIRIYIIEIVNLRIILSILLASLILICDYMQEENKADEQKSAKRDLVVLLHQIKYSSRSPHRIHRESTQ